jgi:hypothetical protein
MELLLQARLCLAWVVPQGRRSWELVGLSPWNLDGRLLEYLLLFQAVNQIPWGLCNNSKRRWHGDRFGDGMATVLDSDVATLSTADATPE